MKELMLELLCYEPYGKPLPAEEKYIQEILRGNNNPPQATLHMLFSGFYNCCQQGNYVDVGWLAQWKAAYGRKHLPLFFKKICFYLMVKGDWAESDFMAQIGLKVSCIRKWNISPLFRKYAEEDTYTAIKVYRSGIKKRYIVSIVKKLYYEAGRQEQEFNKPGKQSMTLSKLPHFVDVFSGTASVAASVVTGACPSPIVNDYDPTWVCFAFAFTHYQGELRKRIAEFHNYLMTRDIKSECSSYDENTYERHHDPEKILRIPEAWDDPMTRWTHLELYGFSEDDIAKAKAGAQCYQEFIMRTRSGYKDIDEKVIRKCNLNALRKIDFSTTATHSADELEDILDYALALFYYHSFRPSGKGGGVYYATNVDEDSYSSYLNVDLSDVNDEDYAYKAQELMRYRPKATSLELESSGSFYNQLKRAKFCCKDFRIMLADDLADGLTDDDKKEYEDKKKHKDGIIKKRTYYLDSPYFLTVGYAVGFSDIDHKDMLDILRKAKFKWIFSMQYNKSSRDTCTISADEQERKKIGI